MNFPTSIDVIVEEIKEKYKKNMEFRNDFNIDEESAINKHFCKGYLDNLKLVGSRQLLRNLLNRFFHKKPMKLDLNDLNKVSGGNNFLPSGPMDPDDNFYSRMIF